MYEYQAYGGNGTKNGIRLYGIDYEGNDVTEDYFLKDGITIDDVVVLSYKFHDDNIMNENADFFEYIKEELCR